MHYLNFDHKARLTSEDVTLTVSAALCIKRCVCRQEQVQFCASKDTPSSTSAF